MRLGRKCRWQVRGALLECIRHPVAIATFGVLDKIAIRVLLLYPFDYWNLLPLKSWTVQKLDRHHSLWNSRASLVCDHHTFDKSLSTSVISRSLSLSLGTNNAVSRTKEEVRVVKALKRNGYPKLFIWRSAPPVPQAEPQDDADVGTDDDNTRRPTVTLPYIQADNQEGLGEVWGQSEIQTQPNTPPATCQACTCGPAEWGGPVKGLCRDVCGTVHSLACRVKEHQRAVRKGVQNASAIADNAWGHQHRSWLRYSIQVQTGTQDVWLSPGTHKEPNPMNTEHGPLPQICLYLAHTTKSVVCASTSNCTIISTFICMHIDAWAFTWPHPLLCYCITSFSHFPEEDTVSKCWD